jgi:hypothetical protein
MRSLLLFLLLSATAGAQTINPSAITVTPPTGTSASPAFVIDSDSGITPETRNKLPVTVRVTFPLGAAVKQSFRVSAQLLDNAAGNTPVTLVAASALSPAQSISFAGSGTTFRDFALNLDPNADLGAGRSYVVRAQIQVQGSGGVFSNLGSPRDSSGFTVVHFTQTGAANSKLNIQAHLTAPATLSKAFALFTNTSQRRFEVSLPMLISRYDLGDVARSVQIRVTPTLTDDLGNAVPLSTDSVATTSIPSSALGSFVSGTPNRPSTLAQTLKASIRPLAQLDSVNRTYRVQVKVEMQEDENIALALRPLGNLADLTSQRLMHFSGTLRFTGGTLASMDSITNTPVPGTLALNAAKPTESTLATVLKVSGGSITGQTGLTFPTISNMSVRLLPSGVAEVVSLPPTNVTVAANSPPLERITGNVRISYTNLRLRNNGVLADAKVHLPQGLGFTDARATSGGKFKSSITMPDVVLQSNLTHLGVISLSSLGSDAWVFDEARPVLYKVTSFSLSAAGELSFSSNNVEWAHKAAFAQLATQQTAGQHETPDMQSRLSNDGYLRFATTASSASLVFTQAEDGSARTKTASIALAPGDFQTHMPLDSLVRSSGSENRVEIRDGSVEPKLSRLQITSTVAVTYLTECAQAGCQGSGASKNVPFTPTGGTLGFTPDGGLFADGTVGGTARTRALQWDQRDGFFSHETGTFTTASLFVPGHQLYAGAAPEAELRAPGAVLYAGFDPKVPGMVYPGTDEYLLGAGAYAGLNFTVANATNQAGKVRVADMKESADLPLMAKESKYYARRSGVSGRHVAERPNSISLLLYGYPFTFSNWEMAFLSNGSDPVAEPSRINGEVSVPKVMLPNVTEFTQKFKALQIGCKGALGDGEIDPSDKAFKNLSYWNGRFKPLDIRFVGAGDDCAGGTRNLTMMVESGAANISTPLYGSLIFEPKGNLGTLASGLPGVDGRLGLPAVVEMRGPKKGKNDQDVDEFEIYKMNPVSKLYFSNPVNDNGTPDDPDDDPAPPDSGYVGFGARCPVPYFVDLEVHVTTSANKDLTDAQISLTSGWAEGGNKTNTFFTNVLFDPTHRGLPDKSHGVITANTYRFQPNDFKVKAKQSLFGLVPLEYPLKWNAFSRDFVGEAAQKVDIIILNFQHQVKYLSAENLEITFGGAFADLGRISLANAAAEGVKSAEALAHSLTNKGANGLTDGVNRLDDLVSDNIDKLIDKTVDKITEEVFGTLYEEIAKSYHDRVLKGPPDGIGYDQWITDTQGGLKSVVNQFLATADTVPRGPLVDNLNKIADGLGDTNSIVGQVNDAVDKAIIAIDIVSGQFRLDKDLVPIPQAYTRLPNGDLSPVLQPPPPADSSLVDGILREVPGTPPAAAKRVIIQTLAKQLVVAFAPARFESLIQDAVASATSSLNDDLNELLLEADPTLDRITEVLTELKGNLVDLKVELTNAQGLLGDLEEVVRASASRIATITDDMRRDTFAFIDSAAVAAREEPLNGTGRVLTLLEEFTKDEMKAFLRAQLRDSLLGSGIIQDIQHVLRQKIAEVRMAVHSAIDNVFAEITKMCAELTKKLLAPLDEEINKALGPVADVLGAGKVDGYAHVEGDTLRRLRIDAQVELSLPQKMNLKAYFEMSCFDSSTDNKGCEPTEPGQQTVEIRIGALDVPLDWSPAPDPPAEEVVEAVPGVELPDTQRRANIEVLFTIGRANPESPYIPTGIGGSFQMTNGEFDFEGVTISELAAAVGIGAKPDFSGLNFAYIAATARVVVTSYEGAGGIFFGKTCSIDPLRIVDPDAASVLGQPPFTGAYVYGEVWLPLTEVLLGIPATCMFKISAGVGAGAFFFVEGPVFGGRITLGLSGEALCAVTVRGTVKLLGVVTNGDLIFKGKGNIVGTAGPCPLCLEFDQTLGVTYRQGAWSVDE